MEAYASFIRAYGVVKLYPVSEIGLYLPLVIGPCDAECHYAVRLDHALDDAGFLKFRMTVVYVTY